MRILHVVPTYLPATRYGGPIVSVHGLCRALAERGHEVHVFTTNVDGDGTSAVAVGEPVNLDNVLVHYFASPFRRLYYSPAMRRALRDARHYDLVHLHSVFLWPTYAAARAARRAGAPYVVSPRGMLVPELVRRKSRLAKSAWIALAEKSTLMHSHGVHFTSQRELEDAQRLALPLPSPFVIPNGVDLPRDTRVARRDMFLFLGRINWKKGIDRLIDAIALVPEVQLVVAGNDEEELTPKLRAQAQQRGLVDRIEFRGEVAAEAKDELLQSAAALVLPSYSENFGNVVLEAMAARTPVVVTPEVGLAETVTACGAGVVAGGEPATLAAALRDLLRDDARRREMGERGRRAVEESFTWPAVAEAMESAYRRITGREATADPRPPRA